MVADAVQQNRVGKECFSYFGAIFTKLFFSHMQGFFIVERSFLQFAAAGEQIGQAGVTPAGATLSQGLVAKLDGIFVACFGFI
ncbi:MAG: hypothetical protein BWY75_02344 [bacterium ADurb.Bin425]|nr:MAG: hypothetical protein BWY75_02344 [bacterium ADurb.Bin425]